MEPWIIMIIIAYLKHKKSPLVIQEFNKIGRYKFLKIKNFKKSWLIQFRFNFQNNINVMQHDKHYFNHRSAMMMNLFRNNMFLQDPNQF